MLLSKSVEENSVVKRTRHEKPPLDTPRGGYYLTTLDYPPNLILLPRSLLSLTLHISTASRDCSTHQHPAMP